jgi:hypothetical protein
VGGNLSPLSNCRWPLSLECRSSLPRTMIIVCGGSTRCAGKITA